MNIFERHMFEAQYASRKIKQTGPNYLVGWKLVNLTSYVTVSKKKFKKNDL